MLYQLSQPPWCQVHDILMRPQAQPERRGRGRPQSKMLAAFGQESGSDSGGALTRQVGELVVDDGSLHEGCRCNVEVRPALHAVKIDELLQEHRCGDRSTSALPVRVAHRMSATRLPS